MSAIQESLQWGRDEFIAEMPLNPANNLSDVALQWGRDEFIAEMPQDKSAAYEQFLLQWGRDEFIAEIMRAIPEAPRGKLASMGPR